MLYAKEHSKGSILLSKIEKKTMSTIRSINLILEKNHEEIVTGVWRRIVEEPQIPNFVLDLFVLSRIAANSVVLS